MADLVTRFPQDLSAQPAILLQGSLRRPRLGMSISARHSEDLTLMARSMTTSRARRDSYEYRALMIWTNQWRIEA
jgi:hypothetical protein